MDPKSPEVAESRSGGLSRWLQVLDRGTGAVLRGLTMVCMVALFVLLLINVISRYVAMFSFGWFDEFVEMSFAYFIFFGAAALWREKEHFKLDFIKARLQKTRLGSLWVVLIDAFSIFFFCVLVYYGTRLTVVATETTPILRMPQKVFYVAIPVASAIMLVYAVRDLVVDLQESRSR